MNPQKVEQESGKKDTNKKSVGGGGPSIRLFEEDKEFYDRMKLLSGAINRREAIDRLVPHIQGEDVQQSIQREKDIVDLTKQIGFETEGQTLRSALDILMFPGLIDLSRKMKHSSPVQTLMWLMSQTKTLPDHLDVVQQYADKAIKVTNQPPRLSTHQQETLPSTGQSDTAMVGDQIGCSNAKPTTILRDEFFHRSLDEWDIQSFLSVAEYNAMAEYLRRL